jgi:thioredoxin 1
MAKEFNSSNFDAEVLQSEKPVAVDFWAEWCGPCKAVAPIIEQLSEEMKDQVTIGKVNVDENKEIAGKYGVMSIPTLIVYKNGNVAGQIVGAMPKEELKNRITAALEG